MYDTDEIREKVDLIALIEQKTALKKTGKSYLGMCPFHDNTHTPALAVFPETRTWKCFGCGKAGDCFAWLMELNNWDFKQALGELAKLANVQPAERGENGSQAERKVKPPAPLPTGPNDTWCTRAEEFITYAEKQLAGPGGEGPRVYLESERGLWPETWKTFRLGYNPTDIFDDPGRWGMSEKKIWLPRGMVIPGFKRGGLPQYVKIRRPRPQDTLAQYIEPLTPAECITDAGREDPQKDPKFGGPRGGEACFFSDGKTQANAQAPVIILSEGEWDMMIAWQYGCDLADFGTLGGAGKTLDTWSLGRLAQYAAIGLVMDADKAGDQARARWLDNEALKTVLVVIQPPDHDLTDFWKHGGNLRAWLAERASELMMKAMEGMENPPERWVKLLAWQLQETGWKAG